MEPQARPDSFMLRHQHRLRGELERFNRLNEQCHGQQLDQTFAVGPGHGIQLSSGPLLVPAYVKEVEGCRQCQSCWCCCGCLSRSSTAFQTLRTLFLCSVMSDIMPSVRPSPQSRKCPASESLEEGLDCRHSPVDRGKAI